LNDGQYYIPEEDRYFTGTINGSGNITMSSKVSVPYSSLVQKRIGIFLEFPGATDDVLLEKIHFYKKIEYVTQNDAGEEVTAIAYPGGPLYSFARTMYYYYDPNSEYADLDSVVYEYSNYKDSEDFIK
jgi:hypothetical protein